MHWYTWVLLGFGIWCFLLFFILMFFAAIAEMDREFEDGWH